MKQNQSGFGAVEVLLLLLLVTIVGFAGYYVWNNQQDKSIKTSQSETDEKSTGGPAPGHTVTNSIKLVTGQYMPAHVDIKKGETVTWEISDSGEIPEYAVASNTDSSEKFSSENLKTGDKFSHTFNTVGTFGWHDKYNGNLTGSVTVTE